MGQITVFAGAERRRRWRESEKLDLVARAFAPGATVTQVASSADVRPSQLYRWRREFEKISGGEDAGFARVVVQSEAAQSGSGAIRVRLDRAQVDIAAHAPIELVTATLKALLR